MTSLIDDSAFTRCDNLPKELSARLDRPWQFAGIADGTMPILFYPCKVCHTRRMIVYLKLDAARAKFEQLLIVDLRPWLFITDRADVVVIYLGLCQDCDQVCWATHGLVYDDLALCRGRL